MHTNIHRSQYKFDVIPSHVVSNPDASSPASFVVPAGQDTQALDDTYWFSAHKIARHHRFIYMKSVRV